MAFNINKMTYTKPLVTIYNFAFTNCLVYCTVTSHLLTHYVSTEKILYLILLLIKSRLGTLTTIFLNLFVLYINMNTNDKT